MVTGYTPQYCEKCQDGFLKKTLESGEEVVVPCSCKIEQDRDHLYKQINQAATIQMYGLGSRRYENKDKWLPAIIEKSENLPITAYEAMHANYLSTTSTRFSTFGNFLKWVGESDPAYKPKHFYLDNDRGTNDLFKYFVNFIAYVFVHRLIPVKYLDYSELKSIVMDKDRNFYEILEPFSVVIIPDVFSEEFLNSLENQYVFDKVSRLIKYIYSKDELSVIVSGSRNIATIRSMSDYAHKPVIFERTQFLLNTLLNNSNVVCCRVPEDKK